MFASLVVLIISSSFKAAATEKPPLSLSKQTRTLTVRFHLVKESPRFTQKILNING